MSRIRQILIWKLQTSNCETNYTTTNRITPHRVRNLLLFIYSSLNAYLTHKIVFKTKFFSVNEVNSSLYIAQAYNFCYYKPFFEKSYCNNYCRLSNLRMWRKIEGYAPELICMANFSVSRRSQISSKSN